MSLVALLSAFGRNRSVPSKGWKVLSSKQYKKLNKGKGAMKTGVHTPKGFTIIPSMLPRYMVPDLTGFNLKPYVANFPGQLEARRAGPGWRDALLKKQAAAPPPPPPKE